jgi:TetR/AcrR family transcriptional repressor of bet genes
VGRPPTISPDHLTDALMRVVAQRGLDAVSVRTVAAEAGVSIGAVQYHFATKDELLLAAYRRAIDQVTARARRIAAEGVGPADYVRALLRELLPLDARREAELRVALAFTARSVFSAPLTALYTSGYRALVDAVAAALELAVAQGAASPGVEPKRDAIQAVAVADGLAWHLLCAPDVLSGADTLAALDAHLDRIVPGGASAPP